MTVRLPATLRIPGYLFAKSIHAIVFRHDNKVVGVRWDGEKVIESSSGSEVLEYMLNKYRSVIVLDDIELDRDITIDPSNVTLKSYGRVVTIKTNGFTIKFNGTKTTVEGIEFDCGGAGKCLDFAKPSSTPSGIQLRFIKVYNAGTAIELTNNEDSDLFHVVVDNVDYGVVINNLAGRINIYGGLIGYARKAGIVFYGNGALLELYGVSAESAQADDYSEGILKIGNYCRVNIHGGWYYANGGPVVYGDESTPASVLNVFGAYLFSKPGNTHAPIEGRIRYVNIYGLSHLSCPDATYSIDATIEVELNIYRAILDKDVNYSKITGRRHIQSVGSKWIVSSSYIRKGIATLPAGATRVTVSHGAHTTPTIVIITPLAQPPGRLWVENIGTTSFDIVSDTAPSSDLPIAWYAEV